jgi:hypothetical protein
MRRNGPANPFWSYDPGNPSRKCATVAHAIGAPWRTIVSEGREVSRDP